MSNENELVGLVDKIGRLEPPDRDTVRLVAANALDVFGDGSEAREFVGYVIAQDWWVQ